MLTQEQLDQLKKYFAAQPVDVVYLFGSQATGKTNKLSDIDIGVLFKENLSDSTCFDLRVKMTADLSGISKTDQVDVVDLEKAPIALRYSAISPKKEILTVNNNRRAVFEAETNSYYFDYVYYIKQNTKNSLISIARM